MNILDGQQREIEAFGKTYNVRVGVVEYDCNNRPAICVDYWDDELEGTGPFGMLTVNMPEFELAPNQCIIKEYGENDGWAQELTFKLGCFEKLFSVQIGYGMGSLVQLKPDWAWK